MPTGRQVLHLLPGDAELDAVLVDRRHGADRDRHYLPAEHVSLLEEHVGFALRAHCRRSARQPDLRYLSVQARSIGRSYAQRSRAVTPETTAHAGGAVENRPANGTLRRLHRLRLAALHRAVDLPGAEDEVAPG